MKRRKLLRYLHGLGCRVTGEGARHTRMLNPANGRRSFVPRHPEVGPGLVQEICKQRDVPPPSEK